MGHPVTTNPFIIMMINMTVVFAVLFGLSMMIRLIHLVDPTKPKAAVPLAPAAAAPAAVSVPEAVQDKSEEIAAVIAAAVAAYGCEASQIRIVRPVGAAVWKETGRLTGIQNIEV